MTRLVRPSERGTAIYAALTFTILVAGFLASFAASLAVLVAESQRERASSAALFAAEGGLARARAALARDPAWTGGRVEIDPTFADVRVAAVPGAPDRREVHARGVAPSADAPRATVERRVRATVRLRGGGALPSVLAWTEGS